MKPFLTAALFCLLSLGLSGAARAQDRQYDQPGKFDFYVLSLSWSPTFCSTQKGGRNDQQCGDDKDFRFIVHGLWPQYEQGYPDFCRTSDPDRVPFSLGQPLLDIMPSMGLIGHEWKKHGSCSGLGQRAYLETIRKAYERVQIPQEMTRGATAQRLSPAQIEDKFVAANPGMSRQGISTSCQGGKFQEIRICMTKDLGFRECQEVDRDSCKASQVVLPPPAN